MSEIIFILVIAGLVFSDRDRATYFYHKVTGSSADVKEHITHNIVKQMRSAGIAPEEVARAFSDAQNTPAANSGSIVTRLFAILGGIFVLAGVGTYVGMFWDDMGAAGHIIVTLGLGIALTIFAVVTIRENKYPRIVVPVLIAAAVACTSGGFVLLHELFPHGDNPDKAMMLVFGAMALHQAFMYQFYPRTLTIGLGMFFVYSALIAGCDLMNIPFRTIAIVLGGSLMVAAQGLAKSRFSALTPLTLFIACVWFNTGLYDYLSDFTTDDVALLITGLSVFALGLGLSFEAESNLVGLAYLAGSCMVFTALFDWVDRTPYDLIFLLASMGGVYVSILLKSRAVLLVSTLSILFFLGYYADRYFINSVGLPVALIVAGFVFIGISAGALKIKKKYF